VDLIDTAVARMVLYKIEKPTEDAKALARVLVAATGILTEILPQMRNLKKTDALITWYYGIPSSSSHALIGGFAGAAVVSYGLSALIIDLKLKGIVMVTAFIVIAPMLGMILGFLLMVATYWICRRASPSKLGGVFRKLPFASAAAYSLGHGGNDAQKTMGIILATLIAARMHEPKAEVPLWVVLSCHAAMALGTLAGGWRIVKTMGQKICKLQPLLGDLPPLRLVTLPAVMGCARP
jgi:phosphate/sulfate permease